MNKTIYLFGFFLIMVFNSYSQIPDERGFYVEIGDSVPDINFEFISGEKAKLSDFKGKIVILNFTASWCGVCHKEMPHIEKEIWQANKNNDLIVIAIDYKETKNKAKRFAKKIGISYPMALDPEGDIFGTFATGGVTRNVVINRDGKIVFLTRLFNKEEFNAMKTKVEELLSE